MLSRQLVTWENAGQQHYSYRLTSPGNLHLSFTNICLLRSVFNTSRNMHRKYWKAPYVWISTEEEKARWSAQIQASILENSLKQTNK